MRNDYLEVKSESLGLTFHPMDVEEILERFRSTMQDGQTHWLANYNLHAIYLALTDQEFARAYQKAGTFIIDGWPVLLLCKFLSRKNLSSARRVGSTDWLHRILNSDEKLTITAIGASKCSSRAAAEKVASLNQNITWHAFDGFDLEYQTAGTHQRTWSESVRASDIVIVGMGMPKQELWIAENIDRPEFTGKVVANVGGCIDYLAGTQELAPRWMGAAGLEWAFRLVKSPRRLAHRYLIEPFLLMSVVAGIIWSRQVESGRSPRRNQK